MEQEIKNLELRKKLQEICTMRPMEHQRNTAEGDAEMCEWAKSLPAKIAALHGHSIGHSIELVKLVSPTDDEWHQHCFMWALGITREDYKVIRAEVSTKVKCDENFIKYMIDEGILKPLTMAVVGCLVIYFHTDGIATHAGIWSPGVVSKWGYQNQPIWKHGKWELPLSYGEVARIYEMPPKEDILAALKEWGLEGMPN